MKPVLEINAKEYLEPLIDAISKANKYDDGFRRIGRVIDVEYLMKAQTDKAGKPFLIRELINVPKIPLGPADLKRIINNSTNKEDATSQLIGHLVEWNAVYETYSTGFAVTATFSTSDNYAENLQILAYLPSQMLDVVRNVKVGSKVVIRGILTGFSLGIAILDYVDLSAG